jgi:hypothetical protein
VSVKEMTNQAITTNPARWPNELLPVFERSLTTEFATLNAKGAPITFPLTPYIGEMERTLDVSTGLTYPSKAERARRNPKVALLYSDPVGSGLRNPPIVLVQGMAAVRDADLQTNTDRYVRLTLQKSAAAFKGMPKFFLRRMGYYFARIWIEVTPLKMLWWPEGRTDEQPQVWIAPADIAIPRSDTTPAGKQPAPWKASPLEWRENGRIAVNELGNPVLTVVDENGFPFLVRTKRAQLETDGFRLELPAGLPFTPKGIAGLTFHKHPEVFTGQQNMVFVGETTPTLTGQVFTVERQIGDWSLGNSKIDAIKSMMGAGSKLTPRVKAEAERRGQPVPKINIP